MNFSPKSRFFLTFASALLAGGIIGFLGSALSEAPPLASTPPGEALSPRAPLLKISNRTNDNPLAAPTAANMEKLLGQYYQLTDEELLEELNLRTRNLTPGIKPLFSESLSLKYLSYRLGLLSPEKGLLWLESTPPHVKKLIYSDILQGCMKTDMKQAISYLLQHRKRSHGDPSYDISYKTESLCEEITRDMAYKSPDDALDWLQTLDDGARRSLLPVAMSNIPEKLVSKMPQYLAKISPQDLKNSKLQMTIASQWASVDWNATKAWINSSSFSSSVLSDAIASLAMVDEEKAKEELHLMDKDDREDTARLIANSMIGNAEKAMDWIFGYISNPDNIDYIAGNVGANITPDKIDSTVQYLAKQPNSPVKERLLEGLVEGIPYTNGKITPVMQTCITLCQLAETPEKQEKLLRQALDYWIDSPDEFLPWLEKASQLSPELKAEYRKKCNQSEKD